jgi:hypothetical protein
MNIFFCWFSTVHTKVKNQSYCKCILELWMREIAKEYENKIFIGICNENNLLYILLQKDLLANRGKSYCEITE